MPSSPQCSTLIPARPSANTTNDTALSNHRLPLSPWSSRSQASSVPPGSASSRHTQNSAVSIVSTASRLAGSSARQAGRLAAHAARALVVRRPTAAPGAGAASVAAMTARRPAARSSRA